MKTIGRIFALLSVMLALASCGSSARTVAVDPADRFVGYYSFMDYYNSVLGGSSQMLASEGSVRIVKISANEVQMNGYWNTTGVVTGNTVYFADDIQSNAGGHLRYTFSKATLSGGVLSFSYSGTGILKIKGVDCPWALSGTVNAKK